MAELLLELYSEEIPPQLQISARSQIKQFIENTFKEENIKYKELSVYSSPTRLTLLIKNLTEKIKIEAKTFDDFFSDKEIENLGFVKIDIEGHEDYFFKGAKKLINKRVPVFFELALPYYRARGIKDKDIINFFNTIFNKCKFYDGLQTVKDLSKLKISNISNVLVLPNK